MKLLKNPIFRISLYLILFLFFAFLGNFSVGELQICPFERFFGVLCPGCGTTRAFVHVMRLEFSEAISLNPLFVFFILPASAALFLQDIICAVCGFFGKKRVSFLDFVLDTLFLQNGD